MSKWTLGTRSVYLAYRINQGREAPLNANELVNTDSDERIERGSLGGRSMLDWNRPGTNEKPTNAKAQYLIGITIATIEPTLTARHQPSASHWITDSEVRLRGVKTTSFPSSFSRAL
jgi:hypothetical protein